MEEQFRYFLYKISISCLLFYDFLWNVSYLLAHTLLIVSKKMDTNGKILKFLKINTFIFKSNFFLCHCLFVYLLHFTYYYVGARNSKH